MEVKPLIIRIEGRTTGYIGFTDLDGTANSDHTPEAEKIKSTGPARRAIYELQSRGIPVGVITSRPYGEANLYGSQQVLNVQGPIICEDGSVIINPSIEVDLELRPMDGVLLRKGRSLVLSEVSVDDIGNFLLDVEKEAMRKDPNGSSELVSSFTSTARRLQEIAGHATLELAELSRQRLASAYVLAATQTQRELILSGVQERRMRANVRVNHPIELFGASANKGRALRTVLENPDVFFPYMELVDEFRPIAFGNAYNDLPLFEEVLKRSGMAILVSDEMGQYAVKDEDLDLRIIKSGPYGYGMLASLSRIFSALQV